MLLKPLSQLAYIYLVSLYMPADCDPSAFFNTLGVMEGLFESQQCQVNILVDDGCGVFI